MCRRLVLLVTVAAMAMAGGCRRAVPPPPPPPLIDVVEVATSDRILQITKTDRFGYPLATPDQREIRGLFLAKDYAKLERVLGFYQAQFENDFLRELWVLNAFASFTDPDPEWTALLDAWVEKSPDAWSAWLARAEHHEALASSSRGHRYAKDTSVSQFEGMQRHLALAEDDYRAALVLKKNLAVAYLGLMGISRNRGDRVGADDARREGLLAAPDSYQLHASWAYVLMPRWGGSHGELEAYVAGLEPEIAKHPRLEALRGRAAWDRALELYEVEKYAEALEAVDKALASGGNFYQTRYDIDRALGNRVNAAIDLQNAVARDPQDVRLLLRYANALWYAGRKAECKGVIERAFELRPKEPGLDPWLKSVQNPAPGAPH